MLVVVKNGSGTTQLFTDEVEQICYLILIYFD